MWRAKISSIGFQYVDKLFQEHLYLFARRIPSALAMFEMAYLSHPSDRTTLLVTCSVTLSTTGKYPTVHRTHPHVIEVSNFQSKNV